MNSLKQIVNSENRSISRRFKIALDGGKAEEI
jgi:hypothetical protein